MARQHQSLCLYHYDPLDCLADRVSAGLTQVRLFYRESLLATQIRGEVHDSILYAHELPLAQLQAAQGAKAATLLVIDAPRTVLGTVDDRPRQALAYTPYGHPGAGSGLASLLGFNGEYCDPLTGHYLLGNGYRAFNPVLMRFNSPDNLSPFGDGGLNAYAYCQGDPVNAQDPTGHGTVPKIFLKRINGTWRLSAPTPAQEAPVPSTSQARGTVSNRALKAAGSLRRSATDQPAVTVSPSHQERPVNVIGNNITRKIEKVPAHIKDFEYLPLDMFERLSKEQQALHMKYNGEQLSIYLYWGTDSAEVRERKLIRHYKYALRLYRGGYGRSMKKTTRDNAIYRKKIALKKARENLAKALAVRTG